MLQAATATFVLHLYEARAAATTKGGAGSTALALWDWCTTCHACNLEAGLVQPRRVSITMRCSLVFPVTLRM